MIDEEEYASDTSDEDYVPKAGGAGSDEEALSEEDSDDPIDDEPKDQSKGAAPKTKRRTTKPKTAKKSKTNASGKKVNPLLAQLQQQEESKKEEEEEEDGGQQETTEVKADEVWADFMADVGVKEKPAAPKPKAKGKSWAELLGNKKKKKPTPQNNFNDETKSPAPPPPDTTPALSSEPASTPDTVKITKVFEFAGEEVRVEEEVAADSKEAKAAGNTPGASGSKRTSGLAGLVSALGSKRQKLSTLQKTKLDWQSYKQANDLAEELTLHTKSKDTYLEKQEFLSRADHRQFEQERDIRLGVRRGPAH